jgi:2-oxo-3-hexenedioate decarboxylase/2-keto-4-pentenoate hydratase
MNAATLLAQARLMHRRLDRLPPGLEPADEEAGYALASDHHPLLTAGGLGGLVGHKIGCTTAVMQTFLGIGNPCSGQIFAGTVQHGSGKFGTHDGATVGVECEIVVWLGEDLLCPSGECSPAQAAAAVQACGTAIEIVEDRYVDYRTLGAPTLIADDFFNAGCVLGEQHEDLAAEDLRSVSGVMVIDGIEVGRGRGSDILGDPLNALAWLAASRGRRGRPLRAGEFVLLGSMVQTMWVSKGSTVRIEVAPLGEVALQLT